jgi:hypothetical protein
MQSSALPVGIGGSMETDFKLAIFGDLLRCRALAKLIQHDLPLETGLRECWISYRERGSRRFLRLEASMGPSRARESNDVGRAELLPRGAA